MSQKKHEFKDVAGKVVEEVNVYEEEGGVNQAEIRFQDKTGLAFVLDCKLAWIGMGGLAGKFPNPLRQRLTK